MQTKELRTIHNNVNLKNGDCNKYFSNLSHWQKIVDRYQGKILLKFNKVWHSFAAMDAFKINLKILPFLYKHFFTADTHFISSLPSRTLRYELNQQRRKR